LLYAQFFLLLAICVIIAFLGYRHYPQGLLVSWTKPAVVWEKSPWSEAVEVYVGAPARFFINSEEVKRSELGSKLTEQLGRRAEWTVYFEADPDTLFMDDTYAIDTIQACGARVVWVTPKMREEWQQKPKGSRSDPVRKLN
jgi:biopolymer transport protein ExbD